VQRISTLIHFCGTPEQCILIDRPRPLVIQELDKLTAFNGHNFEALSSSIKLKFWTRPLRVTVLNDKSDLNVRFDLFERLNSGGVILEPQEIRNCVYRGPFNDLLKNYAKNPHFTRVTKLKSDSQSEEGVLRFFAFLENYQQFEHGVNEFLNSYLEIANKKQPSADVLRRFDETFIFLDSELPEGIVRGRRNLTPVNLFEAISVGTGLVFSDGARPRKGSVQNLLADNKLRQLTTAGTNTRKMVTGRIEYVRDQLS
jgi:hypothetical protein